ncbi:MAG TPA: hypothetical protein VN446_08445 [Candidatus Acidoferrum sp.]|nr:hypothetical protein [Candidatus Acidoferrum sp.]
MKQMTEKKRAVGADFVSAVALMAIGVATQAAPLIILGMLLLGKAAAAKKKRDAVDGGAAPLKGFAPAATGNSPEMKNIRKSPLKKVKDGVESAPHTHMTNPSGRFDPVTGYYALPAVTRCVCPNCGTVTDTSRRFCYKCDTDLKKAHGG